MDDGRRGPGESAGKLPHGLRVATGYRNCGHKFTYQYASNRVARLRKHRQPRLVQINPFLLKTLGLAG